MLKIESTTYIDAIRTVLANDFDVSEIAVIYIDTVPQHFTRPSFAILEIDIPDKRERNNIREKTYMYDILYHPSSNDNIYKEFRGIEHQLKISLDTLTIGDSASGTQEKGYHELRTFVQDSVGHCIVSYKQKVAIKKIVPMTTINDINYKSKLK